MFNVNWMELMYGFSYIHLTLWVVKTVTALKFIGVPRYYLVISFKVGYRNRHIVIVDRVNRNRTNSFELCWEKYRHRAHIPVQRYDLIFTNFRRGENKCGNAIVAIDELSKLTSVKL